MPIPEGLTLEFILDNARKIQGGKFFKYSARDNNCQDFILAVLNGSNIGNQSDREFVKQDTKSLFGNMTGLRKLSNTVTDIGAKVNVITQGKGLSKKKQMKEFGMMINHLTSHITDPKEPVDKKDYMQSKKLIDDMRHIKGGAISFTDIESSESDSDSDSDGSDMDGCGLVDFDKMKWGSFSSQFKIYKRNHKSIKTLEDFADHVINNKNEFMPKTFKRAEFYKNVILHKSKMPKSKKGKGVDSMMAPMKTLSHLGTASVNAINSKKMRGEGLGLGLYAGKGIHHHYIDADSGSDSDSDDECMHIVHIKGGKLNKISQALNKAFNPSKNGIAAALPAAEQDAKVVGHYVIPATTSALGGLAGSTVAGPLGGIAGSAAGAYAGQQINRELGIQGDTSFDGKGLKKTKKAAPKRFAKGSQAAKDHMARLRAMKTKK
jgi:hypothetical protein